jgi:hypothetical protein
MGMQVAGIDVHTEDALELIALLAMEGFVVTADRLADEWGEGEAVVGLSIDERDDILSVLCDPPDGLRDLRAVLLQERSWRLREGL